MLRKLGITVPHLGGTQIGLEVFEAVKAFYNKDWTADVSIFFEQIAPEAFPWPCACYHITELFGYNGIVIATTVNAAEELENIVTVSNKHFYVYDLEWVRQRKLPQIYKSPKLKLWTRSAEYARYIQNTFNVPQPTVMSKFSIDEFLKC